MKIRRRRLRHTLRAVEDQLTVLSSRLEIVMAKQQALDALVRELHTDSWNLKTRMHSDMWAAQEKRALSLAEAVVLSVQPEIRAMRDELIALVGEKAVEVFREVSDDK